MTKQEFMRKLKKLLRPLPEKDRAEIVSDYEEHFRIGLSEGKSEEEIAEHLGDVQLIAEQFYAGAGNGNAGGTFRKNRTVPGSILVGFAMVLFNLIFVLGPYCGLAGALAGLFAASVGMAVGGAGSLLMLIFSPLISHFVQLELSNVPALVFLGIGTAALGALFFLGNLFLAKWFGKLTARYVRWNVKVIINR